jgi:hypothetical protein
MSLAPGDQETLAEIENSLCGSDPRLAAMFADFGRQISGRQGPSREPLSPWRPGLRRTAGMILVIVLALGAICTVLGIALASRGGLSQGAPGLVWHFTGLARVP